MECTSPSMEMRTRTFRTRVKPHVKFPQTLQEARLALCNGALALHGAAVRLARREMRVFARLERAQLLKPHVLRGANNGKQGR